MGRAQHQLDVTAAALPGVHTFQSDVSDPAAIALLKERVHRLRSRNGEFVRTKG